MVDKKNQIKRRAFMASCGVLGAAVAGNRSAAKAATKIELGEFGDADWYPWFVDEPGVLKKDTDVSHWWVLTDASDSWRELKDMPGPDQNGKESCRILAYCHGDYPWVKRNRENGMRCHFGGIEEERFRADVNYLLEPYGLRIVREGVVDQFWAVEKRSAK